MVAHYRSRVSGPLLDRFDLQVEVPPLPLRDLRDGPPSEPTAVVRARVTSARRVQAERFGDRLCRANADMTPDLVRLHARLDAAGRSVLGRAIRRLGLSARAHDGILKIARTIADLEAAEQIEARHVAEAVQHRSLDRGVACEAQSATDPRCEESL
jgi:magnesium chelatase family protein